MYVLRVTAMTIHPAVRRSMLGWLLAAMAVACFVKGLE